MIHKIIHLRESFPQLAQNNCDPKLAVYLPDNMTEIGRHSQKHPCLLICPGGGYGMTSEREAEPIAFKFLAKGFQVFILYYQCAPDGVRYPEQLLQLACSVDYVRKNAAAYGVNPAEVFAVGFSAGGHLVGNLSTDYTQAVEAYGADLDCKLTASGLCYPVISAVYGHVGSFERGKGRVVEETVFGRNS